MCVELTKYYKIVYNKYININAKKLENVLYTRAILKSSSLLAILAHFLTNHTYKHN